MNDFKNTKRLNHADLENLIDYPISEGQTYFTKDTGIFFKDINGQRFSIANISRVDDLNIGEYTTNQKRILNSIIINKNTSNDTFEIYYVKEDGTIVLLDSGGGGGVVYSAGDGISFSPENIISVDSTIIRKQTANWIIENEELNFLIKEVNNLQDIITIYKEPQTSGGVTDAKVNINAKTVISELDFGGW